MKKILLLAMMTMSACVYAIDNENVNVAKQESVKGLFPEDVKTVGIVMPSSVLSSKKLELGIKMLEKAGYRVKLGDYVRGVKKQLPVEMRVQDFEKIWLDPEVDIIFMARGGKGAVDVIKKLNWEKLSSRKMRVIGFSDITLILNAMLKKNAGHPYSGPMLSAFTQWTADSRTWFRKCLDGSPLDPVKVKVLKPGVAKGKPMGGHLDRMYVLLKETSLAPSTAGRIVFIECTARYSFSHMKKCLEEMRDSGYLKDAAAVVFADFRHKGEERRKLNKFLPEFAKTLDCPVFADYPYGHCAKSYLIDFFREIEISSDGIVTAK